MPEIPVTTWFPVVTLLLGFAAKSFADWSQHRFVSRREQEARDAQRRDHLAQRRAEFQRATLLELQDAIGHLARMAGASHHKDVLAYRETGNWQKQQLPEELNKGFRIAQVRVATLRVRVSDERVRDLTAELSEHCVNAIMAPSEAAAEAALGKMTAILSNLNERVGEVLRNLDEAEEQRAR